MTRKKSDRKKEIIELDLEEALILYDYLATDIDDRPLSKRQSRLETIVEDEAQLWAFNGLLCTLEKLLIAPFRPDYHSLLREAKRTLMGQYGPWPYAPPPPSAVNGGDIPEREHPNSKRVERNLRLDGDREYDNQQETYQRIFPLEGLNQVRFGQTPEDILRSLGKPSTVENRLEDDGNPLSGEVWVYGNQSVVFAAGERRVISLFVGIGEAPVLLWNRDIRAFDEIKLIETLLDRNFNFEVETFRWGDVDLIVQEKGLFFSFRDRKLVRVRLDAH